MSESNIGWATLSVIPGVSGFGAALSKGLAPEMAAAGTSAGSGLAKGMLVGIGAVVAGAVAVGVASTKMAGDFQQATTLLVTGAGESESAIGKVRDGLLKMAPAVGIGPTALAKAMFMVESAGFHGAAGLTVMAAAAQGAKVGGADATTVANGLTTALTDYHLPASEAANVTSKLIATVAAGKTTMEQLSGAMSTVLPFASSLGVSFDDLSGAMATMTMTGLSADTSATMLKFTMMSMANETPKGLKALASIGMTAQQLKDDLSSQGVGGALQAVTDQIGKKFPAGSVAATHALAAIVGGTRGMGAALALTGANAATVTADIASIKGAVTEADGSVRGWALTQTDFNVQVDRAKGLASALAIEFGTHLLPALTGAFKGVIDFVTGMKDGTGAGGKFRDVLTTIYKDAIVPIGTFIVGTAIPAVKGFITQFQNGTGAGGDLKDALSHLWTFLTTSVIPAFKDVGTAVFGVVAFFRQHEDAAKALGVTVGIVTAAVTAAWVAQAAMAVQKSLESVGAWAATALASNTSATIQSESVAQIVIGWAAMAAKAVWSGAETVAVWAMIQWDAFKSATATVLSMVGIDTQFIASATQASTSSGIIEADYAGVSGAADTNATSTVTSTAKMDGQWATSALAAGGSSKKIEGDYAAVGASADGMAATTKGAMAGGAMSFAGYAGAIASGTLEVGGLIWFMTTQWNQAGSAWTKAATKAVDDIEGAWNGLKVWINAQDWAKAFQSWYDAVAHWCTRTRTDMWNGAVSFVDSIYQGLLSDAKHPLKWLEQTGSDVMTGFLNGISGGAWSDVQTFVTKIAGWIKANKGPVSLDAQLLVPAGTAMMGGFNTSLAQGFATTKQTVTGMAGQVGAWINAALTADGLPLIWAGPMATLVQRESGGNPNAINLTDSNAKAGHPSQGLAQMIPSTYEANRNPALVDNILDPVSNLASAMRYIVSRYGSIFNVQQANSALAPKGYASGTNSADAGWAWVGERGPELMHMHGGEQLLPASTSAAMSNGNPNSGSANLEGMRLTGTLDLGSGLTGLIDARVSAGISSEASAVRARPRR